MKELVIVSGKGGTGKTSITAALAFLAPAKVLADCDVDAANLHLVTKSKVRQTQKFYAGFEPYADAGLCLRCGKCTELCRFGAIRDGVITSPFECEGCGVCSFNCPAHAISMREKAAGKWLISDTPFGLLVHAELGLAVENSGKLVSRVRQEAKKLAESERVGLIISDGPPGIGCPAIASITGANLVLAVVEPSLSSMHDLERLWGLVRHFGQPMAVCINKSTLNPTNTGSIIAWCRKNNVPVVGNIPYSGIFRDAVKAGKTVMEMGDRVIEEHILELWYKISEVMDIAPDEGLTKSLIKKLQSLIKVRLGEK